MTTTDALRPALSGLQRRTAQRIWFTSWNAANLRSREAYYGRIAELAEKERAQREWQASQADRARGVLPEMCRPGKHKLAEVGAYIAKTGYWTCRGCRNERSTAKRRAKGIMPHARRFAPDKCTELRQQYEAGARLKDLARQEGASNGGIQLAIERAGGTIRRAADTRRLRRELGVKSA